MLADYKHEGQILPQFASRLRTDKRSWCR